MKTFNTQVCTTKEQSKRLLELGLKKGTADMVYCVELYENGWKYSSTAYVLEGNLGVDEIPAWSLHRLMELCPISIHLDNYEDTHYYLITNPTKVLYQKDDKTWLYICDKGNIYDRMIDMIEWLIKNKHFNKEYLEE